MPPAPGIERDVSLVVAEDLRYDTIRTALESRNAARSKMCNS